MNLQQIQQAFEPIALQLIQLSETEQQELLARWADELHWKIRFESNPQKLRDLARQALAEDAEGVDLETFLREGIN